jgi:hypothetical protein
LPEAKIPGVVLGRGWASVRGGKRFFDQEKIFFLAEHLSG